MGRSPMRAAFWGVITAALSTVFTPATRLKAADFAAIVLGAARGTVQVAAACAAAGIVVGVASLTGIGLRMSEAIVTLSGGHLPIALVLTAVGSIILGMGLPTTAAYVVLAALGAPALTDLGVPLLAAHLFIFYFGCLSNVTPPVSLAAYAAAGIAGAPPMTTAFTAMAIAGAGFLVPFMFVYDPALLLDSTVVRVILAGITAGLGVMAFAGMVVGYVRRPLAGWERLTLGAIGVGLMQPDLRIDVVAFALLAVVVALWKTKPIEG